MDLASLGKRGLTGPEFLGNAVNDESKDALEHVHGFVPAVMDVGTRKSGTGWDPDLEDRRRSTCVHLVQHERHRDVVKLDRVLCSGAHRAGPLLVVA